MALIQTFGDLYGQVLAWLDESDNTDTTLTLVKQAINQAHQLRLESYRWPFMLWPTVEQLAVSPAGGTIYSLHPLASKLEYLYDVTHQRYLNEVPTRQLPTATTPTTATLPPDGFRLTGVSHVAAQPATASTLSLVSSNAGDTTASKAWTIKGVVSGAYVEESLTPNGLTPVVSSNAFEKVLAVTKGAAWSGTGTLTAGAVTILTLTANEFARQYPQIELLTTLDAAATLQYRFHRTPIALSAANDIPDIPAPYAQVLVWDTLIQMGGYNSDADPKDLAIWRDNQEKWERALDQHFLEGQTLEARNRRIRYTDDEALATPRIFQS